ncbi:phospholipid carrier-dependent glycosyltransferase [Nocardioides sp. cx-169]|uniref:dolichyl-phosphate-mannose--protein mannosyltransferase n=1 Tax=Nocardioides sp. cx-169 TaxID=2899080 RepID=UPI001E3F2E0F|nr:phospholipid carrier-dependent glycosyltransferase [Nocardioides sp. cx-169]MCD4532554.1 phospholipid carrier-dependent glycosyltransferase [Nocardioides sp. cx-169]
MPLLARRRDPEGPLVSWGAALGVTLLALFLRLWRLGTPQQFEFDETYYAKDAWSMLNHGYVRDYVEDADKLILNGKTTGVWTDDPSMVVHPEVGKWIIALGEQAFGMDPFGWRVSAAVVGALMVLVMCRLVRRLTGSTMLGCVAGLLLSFDGLHFVLSRLALLDIFLSFFLLCAVTCLVVDRDWYRARMAAALDGPVGPESWGPVRAVLLRPWLVLGGVCFGLAVGTKWTAAVPLAAFGILVWLWSAGARRASGVRWPVLRSAVVDGIPAFAQLVVVAFVVYIGTWTGWLVHADEYEEHLSATQYTRFVAEGETCDDEPTLNDDRWPTASQPDAAGPGEVVQSLRSLWSYHQDLFTFHTHFLNCSDHDYGSKPAGWLLLNRPVGVAADTGIEPGTRGCEAPAGSTCLRQVLLLGTPVLWWGGILALLYAGAMWLGARDWRFGFAIVGTASTWLPWLRYDDRPIFFFYAIAALPFIVVALTLAMGRLIGPSRLPSTRRTVGVVLAGSFFVLVLVNFAWFWPIYTHELLTRSEWLDRIWFARWI